MRRSRDRSGERGAVLVMVVVWLPVLILFGMLVFEVGNWFEHKRHLQMQADAGAFAGGGLFNACFGDSATASAAIEAEARKYAGDPTQATRYNDQIGNANQGVITARINRKTFEVAGPPADDTVELPPCEAKMVDVKMTEAGLPWFWRLAFVEAVNARARVEVKQKETSAGALPVGVPDNNPVAGAVLFIDEANGGSIIATQSLTKGVATTMNGVTLTQWATAGGAVNIASARTGVIVALSGIPGWTPSGTLSATCNQVLVECYDGGAVGPWTGLNFIRGYSTTGTGSAAAPIVRDVSLYNQTCLDGSGPYFLLHAGCAIGVRAKVDFGTGTTDPSLGSNQGGVNALLKVDGYGCPNGGQNPKGCNMTYNAAGPNAGYFTTTATGGYPVMPADGVAHPIDLNWGTGSGSNRISGTFTGVQRSYSAGAGSDPVEYVSVSEIGPGANSLTLGSHTLTVTIGIVSSLQQNSTDPAAPATALKVDGSQDQAIDCDPGAGTNLAYELANGCTPTYTVNKGSACESYQYYSTLPQTASWACTRTQTGGSVGQVYQGMLDRVHGGVNSCVNPINWKDVNGDGLVTIPDDIPPGDPRIIPVFVTPFGSFGGSGNAVIPITNFASFYVTGFSKNGGGQGDPCTGADPVPTKQGGWIVGHFIKYVETINTGGGGSSCDFTSFGTCVAVLTQ
jgi:Putative Flp pilus-assembly TadE/G-like